MTGKVTVVYANEQPPGAWDASLFIAGPMPRTAEVPSWRPEALKAVESVWTGPGELVVFVPETRSGESLKYDHHTWEDGWLAIVDVILFWVPRDMRHLPGLTTNVEFGRWESSGRIVLGAPDTAAHVGYLRECAVRNGAPTATTLDGAVAAAMTMIGPGSYRAAAERQIPLRLWNEPEFQRWLTARRHVLVSARVLWFQQAGPRWMLNVRLEGGAADEVIVFGDVKRSGEGDR